MRIGIDVDNCINTLTKTVLTIYNADYDDNLTIDDITEYYMEKFVKPEAKETFYKYFTDKRVWKSINVINNAVEVINQFIQCGHNIYFVTATEPANVLKKSKWLNRLFPQVDMRKQLIICHEKWLLNGLDVLIDDYPKNLIGGSYCKILLDYPWNRKIDYKTDGIIRCKDWNEILERINKIE